jgi:hypothetical protein
MAHLRGGGVGLDEHVAWLERREIPFSDQARLFAHTYWENELSCKLRRL